ncbi:MAG: DUF302 domain-containing protein [Gammaproteobacteria bacterium]|nr:DUF302 domain-containing protein [Gammaproteobacteria bacterium]
MYFLRTTTVFIFVAVLLCSSVNAEVKPDMTEEEIMEFNKQSYAPKSAFEGRVKSGDMPLAITRPKQQYRKNTMLEPITAEAKMRMMQSMMAVNPFSVRDMINMMVAKKRVIPGITFDEVVESIKVKANELNMRASGHNTPWKVLREIDDPNSPRVEFLSFCDLIALRKILDYSLEFSALVPCRIAVLEDADGVIWLTTLDWDVRWLDTSPNPNRISDDLRERAITIRKNIEIMMEAAATGDF